MRISQAKDDLAATFSWRCAINQEVEVLPDSTGVTVLEWTDTSIIAIGLFQMHTLVYHKVQSHFRLNSTVA